jgi:hypothetical protein
MRDGRAILLDLDTNASVAAIADEYGDQLKYVTGPAKEQLGLGAALIRPDGIIAWASDGAPDHRELQKTAARWLLKP